MSKLSLPLIRLLARAQRRFGASRSGSVLILCVALLVLLALIGTAMISASRTDRYSSVQNTSNTELDLLMEAMKAAAKAVVVEDLWSTPTDIASTATYRRPFFPPVVPVLPTTTTPNYYDHWDMPEMAGQVNPVNPYQSDPWLAPRFPSRSPDVDGGRPVWRCLAAPIVGALTGVALTFDSPVKIGAADSYPWTNGTAATPYFPRFIAHPDGSAGPAYPALSASAGGTAYPAGDADGDGIPDCGLKKIPSVEGFHPGAAGNDITYYVGFRIIDNCAAINVNTAWSRQYDFGPVAPNTIPATTPPVPTYTVGSVLAVQPSSGLALVPPGNVADAKGYFRTNVGLLELLRTYIPQAGVVAPAGGASTEMDRLNRYRWSGDALAATYASLMPSPDTAQPYPYLYGSMSDAMEMGMIRRLGLPDRNLVGPPASYYTPFSLADQTALASRFCIAASRSVSKSTLEQVLVTSLSNFGALKPYTDVATGTTEINNWYDQNFNFNAILPVASMPPSPAPNQRTLRSSLVTSNTVSNAIPVITFGPAGGPAAPLIPAGGTPPLADAGLASMASYHATGNVKADINTASFSELWRAFWSVMAENNGANVDPSQPPPVGLDGGMFNPKVVRNLSNPGPAALSPSMMLQLRSAIAAVNAMDLRDGDDQSMQITAILSATLPGEVTSREIPLYNIPAGTTAPVPLSYTARVYGSEKQPFITEIYANTDASANGAGSINTNGYVAIELHNPYNTPMALNRWAVGTITRPAAGGGALQVTPLTAGSLPPPGTATTALPNGYGLQAAFIGGGAVPNAGGIVVPAVVIPAHGYIVLENYSVAPSGNPGDAVYRPVDAAPLDNDRAVYVPNLHEVIGREVVLLRPHHPVRVTTTTVGLAFDASDTSSNLTAYASNHVADESATYDEGNTGAPNLQDFVPLDSYDFSNLTAASAIAPVIWHYVRANDDYVVASRWKFVYPGRYDPTEAAAPRAKTSDLPISWIPPAPAPTALNVNLTNADGAASDRNGQEPVLLYPGIQIANHDWNELPNPVNLVVSPVSPFVYPFGSAFARNGDILQTTFIGAYQIRNGTQQGPAQSPLVPGCMEFNPITMDAALVDDQDPANDANEQLGRFCPIRNVGDDADYDILRGPYDNANTSGWRYRFAEKLFDYLSVQAPSGDYKPQRDPVHYNKLTNRVATPVKNGIYLDSANNSADRSIGVDGLININTAPWWVLASLPLLPNDVAIAGTDANGNNIPDNIENLAKQIVLWRDGDGAANLPRGPFRSIMDLNRVPLGASVLPFQDALIPYPGQTAGVTGDFENRFLMFNRISNLITTRSDSFTVYVVIQGWRNAGAPAYPTVTADKAPQLIVQRRAAFIIDRSTITGGSGTAQPKITPVPTD